MSAAHHNPNMRFDGSQHESTALPQPLHSEESRRARRSGDDAKTGNGVSKAAKAALMGVVRWVSSKQKLVALRMPRLGEKAMPPLAW